MAAGEDDSAATSAAGKTVGKPCRLVVYNRAGEVVGDGVSAQSFMDFKRHCGKSTAVIVELDCGEEVFVETCTLFKRLPRGATYRARLLRKADIIPDGPAHGPGDHTVWVEV